jgi:hypothetical protein
VSNDIAKVLALDDDVHAIADDAQIVYATPATIQHFDPVLDIRSQIQEELLGTHFCHDRGMIHNDKNIMVQTGNVPLCTPPTHKLYRSTR